ncbi:MAG: hypothetical protein ABIJ56_13570 [Pseudomonadota bacterium]
MDKLAKYLLEHIQLDFSGELDMDMLKDFLKDDGTQEANLILAKVSQEGVDDMLIVVADCLKDYLAEGINEKTIRSQVASYGEA